MLPVGRFMASTLPTKPVRIPWVGFSFSLNPGPFSMKEHLLASLMASAGGYPLFLNIIISKKVFFSQHLNPISSFMMMISTQILGYGIGGLFTKLLVDSPYMWWPFTLTTVTMFRAMHETEEKVKGKTSKFQFLMMAAISSFAYYIIPNFFFPSLTALSFLCLIWKRSITVQQIGSGLHGLGLGSFALDWNTISGFLGSPMAFPLFTIMNSMAGFILILYIIVPIAYWSNLFEAKRFPIFSYDVFAYNGQKYNVSRVLNPVSNQLDVEAYNNYSKLYQSISAVFMSGFDFASLVATITHVALFLGRFFRSIWQQFIQSYTNNQEEDVHNHLMKKYKTIPIWWHYIIIAISLGLGFAVCEGFGRDFQLPFWGVLLACLILLIFIPPIGVILASSGKGASIGSLEQLIISYIYPGRPFAIMTFRAYTSVSLEVAIVYLYQLKIGHYMKIPPRSIFIIQMAGVVISSSISFFCNWWLLSSIKNICHPDKLPRGSQWTCPSDRVYYSDIISWGVVGPQRLYYPNGLYSSVYYFFLIGFIMPVIVWLLTRMFPARKWIRLVNFPIIFSAGAKLLPATAVNYWSWFATGILFHCVVLRKFGVEWIEKGFLLSVALDIGSVIAGLVLSVTLQLGGVYGLNWWGLDLDDHCPLAVCPTIPGVSVDGCPNL
ncbi:Oligopeptide transporter OPT protein [Dioscorea alata]|uniref:Oligopeptide transporter OPT protein n=1 Tax=Dioscorea alata TaxID=55571 RepID=A0ACB7VST6_DIOAL|nr:Oligopeptide transporter OPT protein [Dioscorea alata]